MKNFNSLLFSVVLLLLSPLNSYGQSDLSGLYVGPQSDGSFLVPSNQLLRPAGSQVYFPGRPVDLALTPDGKLLVVKNRRSLDLIRLSDLSVVASQKFRKSGSSFTGLSVSGDGRRILVTDAKQGIHIAEITGDLSLQWKESIPLPAPSIGGDPVPGGFAWDEKQDKIYVTLSRNNTLGIVDLADSRVKQIGVGIAPYEVVLASGTKAYVSNWGGRKPRRGEPTYLTSGSRVLVDPETGIASSGTVSVVNLKRNKCIREIEVGLHPSGMVLSPDHSRLYVACANSDVVCVINTKTDEVVEEISVHLEKDFPFGSAPNALAISGDGNRLYIANGTDNAICVVRLGNPSSIEGFIPTGWYPASLVLDEGTGNLYVANMKGIGSRSHPKGKAGYNSHDHMGTISIIPLPDERELAGMTQTVNDNNKPVRVQETPSPGAESGPEQASKVSVPEPDSKVAVPRNPSRQSLFKHVVYIIKENRTYDQLFGDMPQGNGDPGLVHFGREVTPNHHKLAEDFVLLDNFYCSGILSADGHQWTDEAFVTDYVEKFFGDFTRSYPYDGGDPLAYASSGFIWDNVLKHGLTFRNYGEFVDAEIKPDSATFTDIYQDYIQGTGKIQIRARAKLDQIEPYLCPTYISFPSIVPDAYRADEFIKELEGFEKTGDFPNFIILALPNDHTSGTRPGMPTPRASVADNDLALGRIVEAISHSKFWEETCIFVTEDDPQDGLDHVDGHRTVALVVSPYTKRGEVVSTYYSQIDMVRTIEDIFGIPPMNRFDLTAEPMGDCFTDVADFTPYTALPSNIPLDEMNPPLESLTGKALHWAELSIEQDLDEVDRIDEDVFNRILWHSVMGVDKPYPANPQQTP